MNFLHRVKVIVAKTGNYGQELGNEEYLSHIKGTVLVESDVDGKGTIIGSIDACIINRMALHGDNDEKLDATFHDPGITSWIEKFYPEKEHNRSSCLVPESYFLYVTKFEIQKDSTGNLQFDFVSDIATAALYHFLRDPNYIWGQLDHGRWACTSAAVLIPNAVISDDHGAIVEAFLRNGFFPGPSTVCDMNAASAGSVVLVSSYKHWSKDDVIPLSRAEVSTIQLMLPNTSAQLL